jgi:transcriptional regulator with XRE-family HTH domain
MPRKPPPHRPIARDAIGKRLRRARIAAGHPVLQAAADLAGLNVIHLGDLERGRRAPGFETLHRLIRTLKLDPEILFAPAQDHEAQPTAEEAAKAV